MTSKQTPWMGADPADPMDASRRPSSAGTISTKRHPITEAARQRIIDAYTDGLSIKAIERTFHHAKQSDRTNLPPCKADGPEDLA
ncbi:hypothetical protein CGQ24_07360 [Arthrobacter sp. 7749]|nr:hypothetical protein CGQ24_07360 [Arthrobacter sp. 7749]